MMRTKLTGARACVCHTQIPAIDSHGGNGLQPGEDAKGEVCLRVTDINGNGYMVDTQ